MSRDNVIIGTYCNPYLRGAYPAKYMHVDPNTGRCMVLEQYGIKKMCADDAECSSCNVPILAAMGEYGEKKQKKSKGGKKNW